MIEVENNKDQVLSNSNVQVDTSQASSSSQPSDQSNASNQVRVLQQPMLQEIIHWIISLVISQEVYKQDQDWHHFVNTSHLCLPLNLRR